MQQWGDSDYNESRDMTGRVQERIKPIPGKRYGTKKQRNGRLPSSCTWGTILGISVACHSVASKIESRLGPLRNNPRKYDKEQTQEIGLILMQVRVKCFSSAWKKLRMSTSTHLSGIWLHHTGGRHLKKKRTNIRNHKTHLKTNWSSCRYGGNVSLRR